MSHYICIYIYILHVYAYKYTIHLTCTCFYIYHIHDPHTHSHQQIVPCVVAKAFFDKQPCQPGAFLSGDGTRKQKSVQVQTSILTDLHTSDLTHAQESPVP